MNGILLFIVIHQLLFQGVFIAKNIFLKKRLGQKIRGNNIEANISIIFFILFIGLSIYYGSIDESSQLIVNLSHGLKIIGVAVSIISTIVAIFALINLRDSWRVGVLAEQKTELITDGIYSYSRNPYFLAYLLMFTGYTLIIQNYTLLSLSVVGFILIHSMIVREEQYLHERHCDEYVQYKMKVPRYI